MNNYFLARDLVINNLTNLASMSLINGRCFRIIERIIYDESLESEEDFYLVIYYDNCVTILYDAERMILNSISATALGDFIREEFSQSKNILLDEANITSIKTKLDGYLASAQLGLEAVIINNQWELTREYLIAIYRLYGKLISLHQYTDHQVYVDYLFSLRIGEERAINQKTFLEYEIANVGKLQKTAANFYERNLNELPNLKASLMNTKIIPPGVLRGLAVETPVSIVQIILSRAKRVANYFLQQLETTESPQKIDSQNF